MSNYTYSVPSGTLRLDDTIIIQDDRLPEYQTYLTWLRAGNGPTDIADPVLPFPRITVSSYSLMLAAADAGLAEQIEQVALNSGDIRMRVGFMHANEWRSDCQQVQEVRLTLGLSEQACYDLFTAAQTWTHVQEQSGMTTQSPAQEF